MATKHIILVWTDETELVNDIASLCGGRVDVVACEDSLEAIRAIATHGHPLRSVEE
jgi:hypothetical protein